MVATIYQKLVLEVSGRVHVLARLPLAAALLFHHHVISQKWEPETGQVGFGVGFVSEEAELTLMLS